MEECEEKQQQMQQQEQQRNFRSVFPPPRLHPWLMFIHGKKGRNQTFYSLSEDCVHAKSIPNMRRKSYEGSYFGWMMFFGECTGSEDCFLLNPVSMEKIQLPPWVDIGWRSCLLSSPPDDPGCIVLFVEEVGEGRACFRFCKPGDAEWSHQDVEIGKDERVLDVVACGGRMYAYVLSPLMSKLVNFDIGSGDAIIMEAEAIPFLPPAGPSAVRGLVESSGEVFVVTLVRWGSRAPMEDHVRDIVIQKMDICKKEFVRVENIGDRAFFAGRSRWTSCPAKESGIRGNTVYFTLKQDRCLYAFDPEEKSLAVTLPCPDVKENWSRPDWVLPCF